MTIKAQLGHIEIGYTLAIWVILIAFFAMHYLSDGEPLELWLSWPWWARGLSILGPIVIFFLGGLFEKSRQWPKV